MLQGVAGGALALAALWAGYVLLREQIEVFAGALWSDGHVRFLNLEAAFFLVAIGLVLGAGGSLVSLRRIVKTWRGLQVPV